MGGSQPANVLDPSRPSPGLVAPDPRVLWAAGVAAGLATTGAVIAAWVVWSLG